MWSLLSTRIFYHLGHAAMPIPLPRGYLNHCTNQISSFRPPKIRFPKPGTGTTSTQNNVLAYEKTQMITEILGESHLPSNKL